ncbi:hypothetical protein [Treponema peruense]|uniref:Lipoprotein n=1 Tax=Treponema peruense TaxID=2787628 RepID=A0A7T3RDB5_9SPIR|nr:hypothetical protein [Treponema peruense]QQA01013.1 hypothetical protein IWA51_12300 [Treponema peruense]
MKIKFAARIFAFVILPALLFSCTNGIGQIMDEYNSQFHHVAEENFREPVPGDENFNESEILLERYFVNRNASVSLAAPDGCSSYKWTLYSVNSIEKKEVLGQEGQYFILYIPDAKLVSGRTYVLELSLACADGTIYGDSCELVVYDSLEEIPVQEDNNEGKENL